MSSLPSPLPADLLARLSAIRLLCLDVDGVLSDGHLYYLGESPAANATAAPTTTWGLRFSVRDGVGIKLFMQAGGEVAILSEGALPAGKARAASLGIRHAYFGIKNKREKFDALIAELGLAAHQAAFVGDELSDVPLLQAVGFAATVPDAVAEVRSAVHYVTERPGGSGAVREVADLIRRHGALAARPSSDVPS